METKEMIKSLAIDAQKLWVYNLDLNTSDEVLKEKFLKGLNVRRITRYNTHIEVLYKNN